MAWTVREIRVPAGIDLAAYGREERRWAHKEEIRREYGQRPFGAPGLEEELAEGPAARASPVWRPAGAARERGFTMLSAPSPAVAGGYPLRTRSRSQVATTACWRACSRCDCWRARRLAPARRCLSVSAAAHTGCLTDSDRGGCGGAALGESGIDGSPLLETVAGLDTMPPRVWTLCHNPGNRTTPLGGSVQD